MSSHNTHPNTPFGKFFAKIGIWRPTVTEAIEDLYNHLHEKEQIAIQKASGWIAIVNNNLQAAPDVVFDLIHEQFPDVTKESITDAINKVNAAFLKVEDSTPADYETALGKLQQFLNNYKDDTKNVVIRSVVTILSKILMSGTKPVQIIETVLEYVYQTFVKGKIVKEDAAVTEPAV